MFLGVPKSVPSEYVLAVGEYGRVSLDYSVEQGNLTLETRRFFAESHPFRHFIPEMALYQ